MTVTNTTRLDLRGSDIDDAALRLHFTAYLEELRLTSCPFLTDEGLKPFFESGEINTLSLSLCPQLTDLTLELIASYLRQLRSLELSNQPNLSDSSLSLLLASCPELVSLSIHNCPSFTDRTLLALSLFGKLKSLRLSGASSFTERGLAAIPRNLEALNVSGCSILSDPLASNLLSSSKRLRYFDASFCPQLTTPLPNRESPLQVLNLQGCTSIGDSALQTAASNFRSITHLYLAYTSITDNGLQTLSNNFKPLKVLDLSHCPLITDASVKKIFQSHPLLEQLNLFNCPLLSEKYHSFLKETG